MYSILFVYFIFLVDLTPLVIRILSNLIHFMHSIILCLAFLPAKYMHLYIFFFLVCVDESAPVIRNCPGSVTGIAIPSQNYSIVFWTEPTATDPNGPVTSTNTHSPLETFFLGETTVVYVFTDANGNEANCTFPVQVFGKSMSSPVFPLLN